MIEQHVAAKVLIVEDDKGIAKFVVDSLSENGFETQVTTTLKDAQRAVRLQRPDLILLDLGLPDGDGADLIGTVREFSALPIIVLSARTEEVQKARALDLGADDYLSKPFGIVELMARIRVQMRRAVTDANGQNNTVCTFDDVVIDLEKRSVSKGGQTLHLTKLEYRLLAVLVENRGKVLTLRQLLQMVWGPGYSDRAHYVRVYMAHLRDKLEDNPARPKWLLTESGIGYRLNN